MSVWSSRIGWRIVAGVGTVAAATALVFSIGAYAFNWQGPATRQALRVLPLPAASLGWYPIQFGDFLDRSQTLERYGAALRRSNPASFPSPSAGEQRRQAVENLLRDRATFALAKRHGVVVTEADVDQAFTAQLAQGGSRQNTERVLQNLYGWTPTQFKDQVLRVAVARAKLREQLSFDRQLNQTVRQQAERVLGLVQAGQQSFEDLAKTYSEDDTAAAGGDLGFVTRGEQTKEVDDAAFELGVGETSDLVHTKFGFHILKVEAEREVDGQRQIRLRQIFIAAPSVDTLITNYLKQQGVRIFVAGLDWDNGAGRVTVNP